MDFKNTVVVMTSNLGSQMIQQMAGDDYQVIKLGGDGRGKNLFPTRIHQPIDEVVVFHALGRLLGQWPGLVTVNKGSRFGMRGGFPSSAKLIIKELVLTFYCVCKDLCKFLSCV